MWLLHGRLSDRLKLTVRIMMLELHMGKKIGRVTGVLQSRGGSRAKRTHHLRNGSRVQSSYVNAGVLWLVSN